MSLLISPSDLHSDALSHLAAVSPPCFSAAECCWSRPSGLPHQVVPGLGGTCTLPHTLVSKEKSLLTDSVLVHVRFPLFNVSRTFLDHMPRVVVVQQGPEQWPQLLSQATLATFLPTIAFPSSTPVPAARPRQAHACLGGVSACARTRGHCRRTFSDHF